MPSRTPEHETTRCKYVRNVKPILKREEKKMRKLFVVLSLLVVASMALAACGTHR